MERREFLYACLGALLTAGPLGMGVARSQPSALRVAVHPYNSALALLATHRPLLQYLTKTLQEPVEFYTAPSFEAYVESLLAGEYDLPISPPHFALLGMEAGHYVPLTHYKTRLDPLLVVRQESTFQRPKDFAGKRVAMADRSALIRIVVVKWLADAGLVAGRDYEIVERPTHGASISAVTQGEADAGIGTTTALKQVPADLQARLRTVPTGYKFPHLFTLAHRRLGNARIERLRQALFAFTPEHPDGQAFFEKSGFGGMEAVMAEEIASLRPFLEQTRKIVESMR